MIKTDKQGSGEWSVCFDTGKLTADTLTCHVWRYPTKARATEVAKAKQKEIGGFVSVCKGGIEIMAFPRG